MMKARLCVLIDGENVQASYWDAIRQFAEEHGTITSCRVFADFSEGHRKKWIAVARYHSLQPVMQLSGNNTCDIAITVAAMDAAHTGKIEGVCLVSSDKDFTPLVHRLRTGGVRVFGLGESKTAESLRKACTDFHVLDASRAPVAATTKPKAA
jgi:uncharacterized LabA/DUF88 family protein